MRTPHGDFYRVICTFITFHLPIIPYLEAKYASPVNYQETKFQ